MILQSNSLGYIGAFIAGIVVSFSPCVYPFVPVVLGFIGVKAGASRLRGLSLSLVYVSGLAVTYSILGLIASLSGKLFGQISSHPASFLVVGNVCIVAGLSFFDVINISFTRFRLADKVTRDKGYLSSFLLGAASGLVAGPCTAPALAFILAYVASKQNVIYGVSLLFVFAYGVGFLLILVGTFSALFLSLPKPGKWLLWIKRIDGLILIAIGEYFLIQAGRLL